MKEGCKTFIMDNSFQQFNVLYDHKSLNCMCEKKGTKVCENEKQTERKN
jgi:hypothetical protein